MLEDDTAMVGVGFGGTRAAAGEVVFNTGMSGYVETLTDSVLPRTDSGDDLPPSWQLRRSPTARAREHCPPL